MGITRYFADLIASGNVGGIQYETLDTLPTFQSADEGRMVYQNLMKRVNIGTVDGWTQVVTTTASNYPLNDLVTEFTFDSISGTTVYNTGGTPNATVTGSVVTDTGKVGSGFVFNGDNHLNCSFTSGSTWSLSLWIKPVLSAAVGFAERLLSYSNTTGSEVMLVSGTPWKLRFSQAGSAVDFNLYTPTAGQWDHLVLQKQSSSLSLYVNGQFSETVSSTSAALSFLRIGQYGNETYDRPYNGVMDQFRIYNRLLTVSEITAIYNNGSGV